MLEFCYDICGNNISRAERCLVRSTTPIQAAIDKKIIVCLKCQAIGERIDHTAYLINAWRQVV